MFHLLKHAPNVFFFLQRQRSPDRIFSILDLLRDLEKGL